MQVSFLKAKKDNICIPVMAESLKQLMADGVGGEEYAVCDIIELRIDYIKEDIIEETKKILGYLKEIFPKKLFIVTYRTAVEGGMGDLGGISEELFCDEYKKLILQLVKEVRCDFIDVEINRGAHIVGEVAVEAHNRNIAVIGSYHNFKSTPDDEEMIRVLKCIDSSEADVLKMAVMPEGENDVARLMKVTSIATHMFDKPLITMSMGELGTISRVYGFLYGSSVTFGTASAASAPGQINALQLYKDMQIAGNIKIALIGFMGSGKSAVSDALTSVLGIACKVKSFKCAIPFSFFFGNRYFKHFINSEMLYHLRVAIVSEHIIIFIIPRQCKWTYYIKRSVAPQDSALIRVPLVIAKAYFSVFGNCSMYHIDVIENILVLGFETVSNDNLSMQPRRFILTEHFFKLSYQNLTFSLRYKF